MTMQKTIIGTGIFNLDTIVVREYPEWPAMRPFVEKEVLQEVGGTCGNVMCMLATMGPGGVKIKEKGGAWYVIEGVKNDDVVDAEGAGDTFTSAFINAMADGKTVADAAREAMKMASRSVGFLGSKGMFQR